MAEHALVGHGVIHPGNLARHGLGALVGIMARSAPSVVTGGGRVDIGAGVVGAGIEVAIDFEDVGLRRRFEHRVQKQHRRRTWTILWVGS